MKPSLSTANGATALHGNMPKPTCSMMKSNVELAAGSPTFHLPPMIGG